MAAQRGERRFHRYAGVQQGAARPLSQGPRKICLPITATALNICANGGQIMRLSTLGLLTCVLVLTACSDLTPRNQSAAIIAQIEPPSSTRGSDAPVNEFGFLRASESGILEMYAAPSRQAEYLIADVATVEIDAESATSAAQPPASEASDQIAYSYGFAFRIDGDDIPALQQAHVAMCEALGEKCRVLRTSQARHASWDAFGSVRMQIAADEAGDLDADLSEISDGLGGNLISSVRDGEDLSEQIIDTEARLRSRLILRDKLTDILRTNRGSVAELVAAEAAVAEVNEELDSTRSRLEEFQNRIRFSEVNIEYQPSFGDTQVGFSAPVVKAFGLIGSTLGMSIAFLIYSISALFPFALLLLGARWVLHRFGWRLRFWKKDLRKEA